MRSLVLLAVVFITLSCVLGVHADTAANCTYDDALGTWQVSLSPYRPTPTGPSLECDWNWPVAEVFESTLSYPNVATIPNEGAGNWTLIYNQGVEVWINNAIAFFFFDYDSHGNSLCHQSNVGWSHQADGTLWQCMSVKKLSSAPKVVRVEPQSVHRVPTDVAQVNHELRQRRVNDPQRLATKFRTDHEFLAKVNKAAEGWFTVKKYPEYEGQTIGDLERRRGTTTLASPLEQHAPTAKHLRTPKLSPANIPVNFDWRNISGVNYVSPVRDQGQCGSCYSFGSTAMMEARIRIRSANAKQPILSPQDVVSCSNYAQGCEGGFPYLIAGKYGRDYGLLEEACYPYKGIDSACTPNPQPGCNKQRWMTAEYYYIGGYYGQSTVQLMQEEIMANGPIAVSFMAYDDLFSYSGGVYTHKFAAELQLDDYNPFELTNHVVSIVGWGVTTDVHAIPYWIVKNSWGSSWGEHGYFRILRGSSEAGGECAIESITVSAIPILH